MTVKPDKWIIEMAQSHDMIKPFSKTQVRNGISFLVSSYGYVICLSDEFKIFDSKNIDELDPKKDNSGCFKDVKAESVLIPANSFVLARSREYFKIPRNILTVCPGK